MMLIYKDNPYLYICQDYKQKNGQLAVLLYFYLLPCSLVRFSLPFKIYP